MKFKPKVLLAAVESTYGTDIVPTAGANAIEIREASIQPLVADEVVHETDKKGLGNDISALVGKHVVINFKVAVAGAGGAVDAVPAWGVLMEGCGGLVTVNAASNCTITPQDEGEDSLSMYFFTTQALHALLGARGTWKISLASKNFLYFDFTFTGLYVAPTAVAIPTPTLTGFKTPLPVNNANTTFSLDGVAPILRSLELGDNNTVIHNDLPGDESVKITDRQVGGNVTIDAPTLATKNWFTTVTGGGTVVYALQHGQVAGNRVQFNGARVQCSTIDNTDNEGELGHTMNTRFIPSSAGEDDYSIVTT